MVVLATHPYDGVVADSTVVLGYPSPLHAYVLLLLMHILRHWNEYSASSAQRVQVR
jgi:hypothetical protein